MKRLIILSAVITVALCMFLFIKTNFDRKAEKIDGTFVSRYQKGSVQVEYIKKRL